MLLSPINLISSFIAMNNSLFQAQCSAHTARFEAQKIAFSPVVFQCVHIAWKRGVLKSLAEAGEQGASLDTLAESAGLSVYALKVLIETCLSAGVVIRSDTRYCLGKIGYFIVSDPMTQVNYDFIQDVCYLGLSELEECLVQEKPLGLKYLGNWNTIYEGLSNLPEPAKTSWFNFDHFYSDGAFPEVLKYVLSKNPAKMMDIGANTGKWTTLALEASPSLQVTLLDLPVQLNVALKNLEERGIANRAVPHPIDLLQDDAFPAGQDVIWMSQFLCCFSLERIRSILLRARAALAQGGRIFVLDTFWDRQQYDIAAYCLINTSPYFTATASGNSKMYESRDFIECAHAVGLKLVDIRDGIGLAHSLMEFIPE